MKRYLIEHNIEKTGAKPVICDLHNPNYEPFLGIVKAMKEDDSKPTLDFLSFDTKKQFSFDSFEVGGLPGLIITPKLHEIFIESELKGFHFVSCKVLSFDKKERIDYYFMYSIVDYVPRIDYKKTDFVFLERGIASNKVIELRDNSTFESINKENLENYEPFVELYPRQKYSFTGNELEDFKVIRINYFEPNKYFISEDLKTTLEKHKIQGLDYHETGIL